MKNTNIPVQDVLDRANQVRQAEYEKISAIIRRFRTIATLASVYADQLAQDPSYRYGRYPYDDAGPLEPDTELEYRKPSGCDGCPFQDFAGLD